MTAVNPDNVCAHLIKHYDYREDALNYMFQMQNSLQEFVGKKRGNPYPNSELTDFARAKEAIYFWGAATTEWFELIDAQDKYLNELGLFGKDHLRTQTAKLELQYEYIDIWHFLMNIFLYTGIQDVSLIDFKKFGKTANYKSIDMCWSEMSYWVGRYVNSLPYKHWKTYKDYEIPKSHLEICFEHILEIFVTLGNLLDIDHEMFFDLYCSKNEENVERQNDESKGYV